MRKKKSIERHYNKWGVIFAIPFIAAFLIFQLLPLGNTVRFAFCSLKHTPYPYNPPSLVSQGLPWYDNFTGLFKTSTFRISLMNTFHFWLAQTIPEYIIAFWLAAMMTDRRLKLKGRSLFKTGFFFPNLMAGSTVGSLVFANVTAFVGSTVTTLLIISLMNGFGVTEKDFNFFLSQQFFIIFVSVFMHMGITFIYAIAGMTSIPVEIFEAAEIDGSSRPHTFFHITLPCMRPILFFIVVLSVVDGLAMCDIPSTLGDPYDITRKTETLMMYLQNLLSRGSAYGKASAFCIILLGISAITCGLIYFFLIRDKYDAKLKRAIRKEKLKEKLNGIN